MTSSRHARPSSPPLSTAYSTTSSSHHKPNVVSRLAIEGKARRGSDGRTDGASIRVYLKISIPQDTVSPGATIPLFAEENLKILNSQVHPLDPTSAPYYFSSSTSPLLHKAAGALSLPPRLDLSYDSIFDPSSWPSTSTANAPPLDEQYTGVIIVSGYHVSFVLPKEFPPRHTTHQGRKHTRRPSTTNMMQFMAAIETWVPFLTRPPSSPYLLSIPTPRCLSNHIKLSIFSPVISSTSASLASLSSGDEESTTWDLTSEPHVTRSTINRLSRTNSGAYTSLADDESSESSTIGFAEGYGLRGTFQSTDRIRVRWAKPIKTREAPEAADGRRRVGIRDVTASMTCAVLGSPRFGRKGKNRAWDDHPIGHDGSIAMKLEYSATCKGVCFPGVATMLGMDIGLDVGDCEVEWAPEGDQKWSVTGGSGFTGYAVGPPAMPTLSHQSSEDFPSLNGYPSTPGTRSHVPLTNGHNTSHQGSTSISLMRAPLPVPQVPEYSFENSPSSSPASSLGSLATLPSSPEKNGRSRASYMNGASSSVSTDTDDSEPIRPPKAPITIHINMNDLLPPSKNVFTFHISGFIIVRPRNGAYFSPVRTTSPTQHRPGSPDSEPVSLPQFRVFSSDRESSSTLLQNEINEATLDVYNPTGHISDPQSRKTVLQPGGQTKCGSDGARIVVRPSIPSPPPPRRYSTSSARSSRVFADEEDEEDHFGGRKQNGFPVTPTPPSTSSKMMRETMLLGASISRPKRDGPLMVHSAVVTITPRPNTSIASRRGRRTEGWKVPREYAVRVCLPVPAEAESDWLEFGLALTPPTADGAKEKNKDPREVHVASASVESVPVKFETFAAMKPSSDLEKLNVPFERVSGKEWNTWVKVHVGESGGGMVEVVYLVNVSGEDEVEDRQKGAKWKGKEKEVDPTAMDVLLPIFSLPVGRLEVHIEAQTGCEIASLDSNITHQQISPSGSRLLHYSMEEFFEPKLAIIFSPPPAKSSSSALWKTLQILAYTIPAALLIFLAINQLVLDAQLSQTKKSMEGYSSALSAHTTPTVVSLSAPAPQETVTVTMTSVSVSTSIVLSESAISDTNSSSERNTEETIPPSSRASDPSIAISPTTPESPSTTSTIPTVTPSYHPYPEDDLSKHNESTIGQFALDVLRKLPVNWSFGIEVPEATREAIHKAVKGFGLAWQVLKKILHYPMDPP